MSRERPPAAKAGGGPFGRGTQSLRRWRAVAGQVERLVKQTDASARSLRELEERTRAIERATRKAQDSHDRTSRRLTQVERLVMADIDNVVDERFAALAGPILEEGRTMLGADRLYTIYQAALNAAKLEGAVAEAGVYRGGVLAFMAAVVGEAATDPPELHGFDVFDSAPPSEYSEEKAERWAVNAAKMGVEDVQEYLAPTGSAHLHVVDITDETLAVLLVDGYRLVHVDVNAYAPTLASLRQFGSRLVPGGLMVLDDFRAPNTPGVEQAVDEWWQEAGEGYVRWEYPRTEQLVLIRTG